MLDLGDATGGVHSVHCHRHRDTFIIVNGSMFDFFKLKELFIYCEQNHLLSIHLNCLNNFCALGRRINGGSSQQHQMFSQHPCAETKWLMK